MSVAQSKEQFDSLFQQKYKKQPVQVKLEFEEEPEPTKKLSDFNNNLKKGLGFNPNEDNE